MIKVFAEAVVVGTQPRARGRAGETQGSFLRRTGRSAFGQITGVNRSSVRNLNTTRR